MFELAVKAHFAASHCLRGHQGKCKNLHGHTWKVEVVLGADKLNDIGMVVDFADVKKQFFAFLDRLDHVHLNDVPPFDRINPTTENLARYIHDEFPKTMGTIKVKRVTVWESDSASVTYYKS